MHWLNQLKNPELSSGFLFIKVKEMSSLQFPSGTIAIRSRLHGGVRVCRKMFT